MRDLLYEIDEVLGTLRWELNPASTPALLHFTGRSDQGRGWVVQLVTVRGQQMAAASSGSLVVKLPDELAQKAEQAAKAWLRGPVPEAAP